MRADNRVRQVLRAMTVVGTAALLAIGVVAARADEAMPADVAAILERMKQGHPPSVEEQKRLQDWYMRKARPQQPDDPQADARGAAAEMPDDVKAIMAKVQRGERPTPAELARLQQYRAQMAGQRGAMAKDADQAHKAMQDHAGPSEPNSKRDGRGVLPGTLIVDHTVHTLSRCGANVTDATTETHLRWDVHYRDLVRPGQAGYSLAFTGDPKGQVTGSVATHGTEKSGDAPSRPLDGKDAVQMAALVAQGDQAAMINGELLVDGKNPRAYLWLQGSASTGSHAVALAGVTPDDLAASAPWQTRPAGDTPQADMARQALPPPLLAGMRAATFDLDGKALRKAIDSAAQGEVKAPGRLKWSAHWQHDDCEERLEHSASITFLLRNTAPAELEIAPQSPDAYHKWLPLPWTDDAKVAAIFGVAPRDPKGELKVTVAFKPQPGGEPRKGIIQLALLDVDENPGICGNYPPMPRTAPEATLRFRPDQPGIEIDDPKGSKAHTRAAVSSVTVTIVARDTAAWGRLQARCDDLGLVARVHEDGDTALGIPLDHDGDHIADAWQKQMGVGSTPNDDSETATKVQTLKGDSLTVWEEYRGLVTTDEGGKKLHFERFDPHKLDRFFFPMPPTSGASDDRADMRLGCRLFAEVTGMEVHWIEDESLVALDTNGVFWRNRVDFQHLAITPRHGANAQVLRMVNSVDDFHEVQLRWKQDGSPDLDANGEQRRYLYYPSARTLSVGEDGKVPEYPQRTGVILVFHQNALTMHHSLASGPDQCKDWNIPAFLQLAGLTCAQYQAAFQRRQAEMDHELLRVAVAHELMHAHGGHHHNEDGKNGGPIAGKIDCLMRYWEYPDPTYMYAWATGAWHPDRAAFVADPDRFTLPAMITSGAKLRLPTGTPAAWTVCPLCQAMMKSRPD